jgi:hypothetical protein
VVSAVSVVMIARHSTVETARLVEGRTPHKKRRSRARRANHATGLSSHISKNISLLISPKSTP